MGVHSLETFLKTQITDGFKDVNIMQEILTFKQQNYKKKPILIFDVMSIVSYLCENKHEILCGGCHDFYYDHLSQLFSKFTVEQDCELYFFMDGYVQMNSKFSTWRKRQNDKYKDNQAIIHDIYEGMSVNDIIKKHRQIYVNNMLTVIEAVAIKFGTLKYAVNLECDQEIAEFAAQQWRVLAVFSDDTDFLIFGGRWRYFSMKYFQISSLRTKEYNRVALRKSLGLSEFQMSILATCLGNDIICHTSLNSFHKKFAHHDKVFGIAEFIRKKITGIKTHTEVLEYLVKEIFGVLSDYYKNLISKSINSYNIHYRVDTREGQYDYLLKDHMLFTRNVLCGAPFNLSLIFYDLQQYSRSYFDISIAMLQRQAGLVFAQAGIDTIQLTVYSKLSQELSYDVYKVEPILPPFDVISMKHILSDHCCFDVQRYQYLSWTICWDKLIDLDLRLIPSNYLIDTLTLTYLVQNGIISCKEADLILFSIKRTELKEKVSQPPAYLDPRAFHVAFLYTRMFANVSRSIEICGLKKKHGKPLNFNGIDFHNLYNHFKDKDFDIQAHLGDM